MSTQEASKVTAIKDQAVGTIKETIGNVIGNDKMKVEGKEQKEHGKTEYECAKAKTGDTETHQTTETPAEGKVEGQSVSSVSAVKDQTIGSMKQTMGSMTNNPDMELKGKAQQMHGKNEAEFAKAQKEGLHEPKHYEHGKNETEQKPQAQGTVEGNSASSLSATKDQAMGSMKEKMGSMTNNPDMELKGKAQQIHGKNEAEFAKAQKQGLQEPEHYAHGSKTTQTADGSVEGQKVSSLSAMKDQAVGSVKESFGNATGDLNTQIAGKAQQMHGKNEAEFAKAQKQGLPEPAHYEHGTHDIQPAQGQVIGEEQPSKMTGYKDQATGAVKESFGSLTGNQNMEIEGKAQKFHGANQCTSSEAQKNPINA